MASPFIGQIEAFAFDFAPRNWLPCAGQLLPVRQYQALAALLGKTYGGDGVNNFGVPDLRARVALGGTPQAAYAPGQIGGEESHQITFLEVPQHTHNLMAASTGSPASITGTPGPTVLLSQTGGLDRSQRPFAIPLYVSGGTSVAAAPANAIGTVGGQPHENRMPGLALNFCICTNGIIPSPG